MGKKEKKLRTNWIDRVKVNYFGKICPRFIREKLEKLDKNLEDYFYDSHIRIKPVKWEIVPEDDSFRYYKGVTKCRIICKGGKKAIVQFEDGYECITLLRLCWRHKKGEKTNG